MVTLKIAGEYASIHPSAAPARSGWNRPTTFDVCRTGVYRSGHWRQRWTREDSRRSSTGFGGAAGQNENEANPPECVLAAAALASSSPLRLFFLGAPELHLSPHTIFNRDKHFSCTQTLGPCHAPAHALPEGTVAPSTISEDYFLLRLVLVAMAGDATGQSRCAIHLGPSAGSSPSLLYCSS